MFLAGFAHKATLFQRLRDLAISSMDEGYLTPAVLAAQQYDIWSTKPDVTAVPRKASHHAITPLLPRWVEHHFLVIICLGPWDNLCFKDMYICPCVPAPHERILPHTLLLSQRSVASGWALQFSDCRCARSALVQESTLFSLKGWATLCKASH